MEIRRAMVVGAGAMGAGIAQVFAQNGIPVCLTDLNEETVTKGLAGLESRAAQRVARGKMSAEEKKEIFSRIAPATGYAQASGVDIVVEAVFEDMGVKKEVLARLDEAVPERAILASNTTSLSITEMASATSRPERVVGLHFFNPPVAMKLVEIMPGLRTSEETVESARDLVERLGKAPVVANFDSPAGVASRVLAGMLNEAVEVYADGLASAEDVDKAMRMGAGLPMGPLALIDLIGVDIHLAKTETLYRELGDSRYRPHFLLRQMVRAGRLGRKTGHGFFAYGEEG